MYQFCSRIRVSHVRHISCAIYIFYTTATALHKSPIIIYNYPPPCCTRSRFPCVCFIGRVVPSKMIQPTKASFTSRLFRSRLSINRSCLLCIFISVFFSIPLPRRGSRRLPVGSLAVASHRARPPSLRSLLHPLVSSIRRSRASRGDPDCRTRESLRSTRDERASTFSARGPRERESK